MESIDIEEDALAKLAEIGFKKSSLRYAVQLLNPCSQLAKVYRIDKINLTVLNEVRELFSDAKQSARLLNQPSK